MNEGLSLSISNRMTDLSTKGVSHMADQVTKQMPHVDRLVDAPVIFFDAVPTFGARAGVLNAVLAVHVSELTSAGQGKDHVVAVANLRFTAATALQLKEAVDKMLLATASTPGAAN